MRFHSFQTTFLAALLLCGAVAAAAPNRCAMGMVGEDAAGAAAAPTAPDSGVRVVSLLPGGPAAQAGILEGDVIVMLDGKPVRDRATLAAMLAGRTPGERVRVELMRQGHRQAVSLLLMRSPNPAATAMNSLDSAVGGDRVMRPLAVPQEIREKLAELRRSLCAQLAALPHGIDPEKVTDTLQDIRDLARDANPDGKGWMEGRAGEASVSFKDDQGSVMLRGSNNLLTVELFDKAGKVTYRANIDTPEQRAALPDHVVKRLQNLK